jgi:hypothetical protein
MAHTGSYWAWSTRVAHGGQCGASLWTVGTVHGGPRPSLSSSRLTMHRAAPSSLCLAAALLAGGELARSRAVVAW